MPAGDGQGGLDDGLICAASAADMDLLAAGEDGAHQRGDERVLFEQATTAEMDS